MAYTTIDDPTIYFNTKLYTGTGSSQSITGVGFQPDWIWFKNRTSAQSHALVDSVRGRKGLQTNDDDVEYTLNTGKDFTSFDSDGFTVGVPEQLNSFNYNTGSIVAWNWKAGGSASSNGNGSITSSVSVSTDAGFSIVSYTGTGSNATVGHGLGSAPGWFVTKSRDTGTEGWMVFHQSLGATKGVRLNENANAATVSTYFNDTAPTNSVFSIGTNDVVNKSGDKYIAYCFAEKKGYSKFGSYTANGDADGTFVYTGFAPSFIIFKRTDSGTYNWVMMDNKRNTYNPWTNLLLPNLNNAEITISASNLSTDFLSNGFKLRSSSGANPTTNQGTVIYMAFAESPFVNSNGVPNNAR